MILTKNYIIEGNILKKGTQITLKESVDNITIGNWKVYTDANGSNNLLFLYNNVLKFTMTPTGNMVASDYTERD